MDTKLQPKYVQYWGEQAEKETMANIPLDHLAAGRASISLGFDRNNFLNKAAGGIPMWGADLNGALRDVTQVTQAYEAGAIPNWSSPFAQGIQGYPAGGPIRHKDILWMSLENLNTEEPTFTASNWISLGHWLIDQILQSSGTKAMMVPLGGIIDFGLPQKYIPQGFVGCFGQTVIIAGMGKVVLPDTRGRVTKGIGDDTKIGLVSGNDSYNILTQNTAIGTTTDNTSLTMRQVPNHTHNFLTKAAAEGNNLPWYAGSSGSGSHEDDNFYPRVTAFPTPGNNAIPNEGGNWWGSGNQWSGDRGGGYKSDVSILESQGGQVDGSTAGHAHGIPDGGLHNHALNIEPPNVQVYKIMRIY